MQCCRCERKKWMKKKEFLKHSQLSIGYPGNLDFEYSHFSDFLNYRINNIGCPFSDGSHRINSKKIEQKCIAWFAKLYKLKKYRGYITTGGSEGNLYGLFMARQLYPNATILFSEDSHYSVFKAANILKIPYITIPSNKNGEINYKEFEQQVTKQKGTDIILNLNIGTTMKGAIDNIDILCDILNQSTSRYYIHADAALSGGFLPFLDNAPKINFKKYPIDSLSISGHKFIGSPIPYGIVIIRKKHTDSVSNQYIEYIGCNDLTILGSRSGLAALFLWDAIKKRKNQFATEISVCINNARYLHKQLKKRLYHPFLNEYSITVFFDKPSLAICKKWQLAIQGNLVHIVVMQHVSIDKIDQFLEDLNKHS